MAHPSTIPAALILLLSMTPGVHAQRALDEQPPARNTAQPAETRPAPEPEVEEPVPMVSFGIFREPIELTTLIDYVGSTLDINIVVKGSPAGEIVFNAPVRVPKGKLIDLLDAMLEQYGFTITFDPASGFYIVQPLADIRPVFGDELASTRIIPTPNIKPSLLVEPLRAMVGGGGQGAQGGAAQGGPIQAVDELGVLIINAPSRDIRRIERMVDELIKIDRDQQYIRFELDHLAAPIALDRVVGLAGGTRERQTITGQNRRGGQNQQQGGAAAVSLTGGSLTNLGERMTIDPQGNALIFKGTDNEIDRVRQLLAVIDVPNTLEPRNYFAGSSASQIADIAKRRGLGEVIQIESQANQLNQQFNRFGNQNNQFEFDDEGGEGGPVMVVDPARGNIIYYGTPEQQAQLADLLDELRTEDERVVIREYTLNHTDALTITDLLMGIITGESQTGDSDLLPGGTNRNQAFFNGFPMNLDGESTGDFDPDKIAVIADEFSNQVIIKAPIKQQEELEKLIERLDKQRAQVYIQAMIVSVADNEDMTLAFESQFTDGDFSYGTNFGLSTRDSFTEPKDVAAGLSGFTSAIIRSDYVPIIINATQTNTEIRILSTPQLLVNDNEESEIISVSQQPFTELSQGGDTTIESFGGFEDAGTTLRVTPSISAGGFLRLAYFVELSNFTAASGVGGSPPPRDTNSLEGSITVPSNATVVLGGITVEDVRDTVIKVPLLGDIPLVGELFKRTNKINNKSKLYVFLTPRIMADPNFTDLRLFSQGPQQDMDINPDVPVMLPAIIGLPGGDPSPSLLPRPMSALPGPQDTPTDVDAGLDDRTDRVAPALEPAYIEHTDDAAGND